MPQTAPLVRLSDVDVNIAGSNVLRGIDLSVHRGQHLGVVGDNGSGKSTLLALIAGQRWPAPGRGSRTYDFGHGPERDAVSARRRIALIGHELQDLYTARGWNFTAFDVVLSGVSRTDIPQRIRTEEQQLRAKSLLEQMRLDSLGDRRFLELSRGQQRRVLITRALAFAPELLLLDEPLSGLDANARHELIALLARVAEAATLVITAHRTPDLPHFVTAAVRVRGGRVAPIDLRPSIGDEHADAGSRESTSDQSERCSTAADSAALIEVAGASVFIDRRRILDAIDWRLLEGEHWLVTGANGAGKSTFLRLLHGELRPARGGTIRWPGLSDPRNVWALRRLVALVSAELQARYRYPASVFDAVASGFTASIGRTRPLTQRETERVDRLLDIFELSELRHRHLKSLSYGQRHRALIARTLAVEPRVLLLDEPWEGLDASSAAIVRTALEHAMRSGTQLVCVSHVGACGLPLNRELVLAGGSISRAGGSA